MHGGPEPHVSTHSPSAALHAGAFAGQSRLVRQATQRFAEVSQIGRPSGQSALTRHATQTPRLVSHRAPLHCASAVHVARHCRETTSHIVPFWQSVATMHPTHMPAPGSQRGAEESQSALRAQCRAAGEGEKSPLSSAADPHERPALRKAHAMPAIAAPHTLFQLDAPVSIWGE